MADSVGKCAPKSTAQDMLSQSNASQRSTDRVFVHALNTVKRIPRTGSARPPESDRLKLYGLYKQSTEGDVEGMMRRPERGGREAIAEREKWDAWHSNAGLSRTEAKRQYISTLIETMHCYATTTPEARELVSELEFVWDQIKSNSASSSGSSPGQLASSRQVQEQSRTSHGPTRQQEDKSSGLRVLRPVSDGDAEEEEEEDDDADNFERARPAHFNDEDASAAITGPPARDLDVRNRKWRKRVEQALVKMTVEVAALREQMEAQRIGDGKRKNGVWAWMRWLVWMSLRHILFDVALLALLAIWARRKGDHRAEQGLRLMLLWVKEQVGAVRIPRVFRWRVNQT